MAPETNGGGTRAPGEHSQGDLGSFTSHASLTAAVGVHEDVNIGCTPRRPSRSFGSMVQHSVMKRLMELPILCLKDLPGKMYLRTRMLPVGRVTGFARNIHCTL